MVLKPQDPPGRSFVGMQWLGNIFLSIAIAAGSAPVRWPDIDSCTCLLHPSVAQQKSQYQVTERLHQGKRRCCKTPQNHHTNRFIHQEQQLPPPRRRSKWKTCFSECHQSGKPLEKLGLLEIAPELLQEMNESSARKQYETDAMQGVAEHMNLKPCDDAHSSQVNSAASTLTHNTHTTNGNESLRLVTSVQIEVDLSRAQGEFHTLSMRLRELAPDHGIFDETAFLDDAMDEMSLGSQRSARLHELYKETRRNSLRLRTCINEIKQSVSLIRSPIVAPPPNSGSAAPSIPVELRSQTEQCSGVVQGS